MVEPDRYDRAYFDHWYRAEGFGSPERLDRKVRYALGAAEYLLDRRVTSVLDVGCGEAPWCPQLRRLRPGVRYVGVDPSAYAARRYGRTRNIRRGGLAELADLALGDDGPFDLIVCVDVLAYADAGDVRRGLRTIADLLGGVALIEVFTDADDYEGDLGHDRPPATYRRWFSEAGLHHIGPHLYAGDVILPTLATFERGR